MSVGRGGSELLILAKGKSLELISLCYLVRVKRYYIFLT